VIVERTDFVSVPVTDVERSAAWYRDTLGLEQIGEGGWPEFQLGENVSLYLIDPTNVGREFTGPHTAYIALRVPDVGATRRSSRNAASSSTATSSTPASATWPSSTTPTGTR
jgi:catechol 2,3-dioxygenase-like lactoylglutathione lyase family enzyme